MSFRTYSEARIVVVDNEPCTLHSVRTALESAGYPSPFEIADPTEAPLHIESATSDLVVFDVGQPGVDGYGLLANLTGRLAPSTFLPVLAVGSLLGPEAREQAYRAGAKDFLAKPLDLEEFLLHVHSLLDTRFVHLRLEETRIVLEDLVARRTAELRQAQLETIELLGRVAEVRDDATGQHTRRVGRLAGQIAQELHLPTEEVELIAAAAPLHDLGKVAIADSILLKQGSFEGTERESMRHHAALGADLLKGSKSDLLRVAGAIAAYHHERWDGQGYPHGLKADAIPLAARIVAVADAFDALTHARPYKEAWSDAEALAEIERERGWQFDPAAVDALFRVYRRHHRILHISRRR
ncbi:MAG: HD domain-containing protein [Actinobacteria bacterium]|nr:HD domain-containing protein [Actinomycetota bacterium]